MGKGASQNSSTNQPSKPGDTSSSSQSESSVLVVYFSQPDDVDGSSVVIDGETLGNTQYMANAIQDTTGADIFRITSETPYPTDHKDLVNLASEEQANAARPAIAETIENFDKYETVLVGYPNWWGEIVDWISDLGFAK